MSENDPFFDAWVRDKLLHTEVHTPEHLWDTIRKRSRTYVIMERNKYFLILLLLLGATTGTGYWVFHISSVRGKAPEGILADGILVHPAKKPASRPTFAGNAPLNASTASGSITSASTLSGATASGATTQDATFSIPENDISLTDDMTAEVLLKRTTLNADILPPFSLSTVLPAIHQFPWISTATRETSLVQVKDQRHTYFEFYAGPDHVTHYISTSNKAFESYVAQKRAEETSSPSFSMGARLDMPLLGNDWRLQTGIHYSQINEHLNYANFDATKLVTEVSVLSMVQSNGTTVQVRDTSKVSVKGQFLKESLNAYRRIDIPVIISRTLFKAGQVQMNGSTGALFNLVSWYDGDVLDTNDLPSVIQTKTNQGASAWKKHIGTSLYGSLSLYDQVFDRVQATFEPYLRYDLSTVNKDVSIYRERFVTTGLMVGIRYQLGK